MGYHGCKTHSESHYSFILKHTFLFIWMKTAGQTDKKEITMIVTFCSDKQFFVIAKRISSTYSSKRDRLSNGTHTLFFCLKPFPRGHFVSTILVSDPPICLFIHCV